RRRGPGTPVGAAPLIRTRAAKRRPPSELAVGLVGWDRALQWAAHDRPGRLPKGWGVMAEPPTTSPAVGAAPARDVLVATKFHVPPAGFVPRPRLLEHLARGIGRGLTVVCTPAGVGKTTLLADWPRRSRRPAAWLSLDAGDNDPARFWRYVAAALERVRPGLGEQVGGLLRGTEP